MIKEIRELNKENHSLATMIYNLIIKGRLKRYTVDGEHIAYDTEEYKQYRMENHYGRPPKGEMIKIKGE